MKKGFLIYNPEDLKVNQEFVERLINHSKNYQLDLKLITTDKLQYGYKNGRFYLSESNTELTELDFAVNRSRNVYLTKTMENMGVRVFNNSSVATFGNDKISAHLFVSKLGIKSVDSIFFNKEQNSTDNMPYPVIVKSLSGFGGKQVYKAENKRELKIIIDGIPDKNLLLQRYVQDCSDVRVFVMGGKVIGAVKRTPKEGFRANYKLGGSIELYELTSAMSAAVKIIVENVQIDFAGLDFLVNDRGGELYFNEIEDVVGSRSLCKIEKIDTSLKYIEYISKIMYNDIV